MADSALLRRLEEKVQAGERLSFDEGVFLDEHADLFTLGRMANLIRERKNGKYAFYNTNIHLNPTNVCVYRCRFCAFRADLRDAKAYTFTDDMLRERILEGRAQGATEIHVVGGLHHQKPFDWYVNVVRVLHETSPEIHIKAWTGVEINWFSYLTKKPIEWVLEQLLDAGLGSLPGGGAEIFDPEVRGQICEHKADGDNWLAIHRAAHQLGLRSNATMLYGHVEQARHRVDHLLKLRALQDRPGASRPSFRWRSIRRTPSSTTSPSRPG
jgi:aminodeoxyfutalosine synthase